LQETVNSYSKLSTQEIIDVVSHYIVHNIMKYYNDNCRTDLDDLVALRPLFHELNEPTYQRDELSGFILSQEEHA